MVQCRVRQQLVMKSEEVCGAYFFCVWHMNSKVTYITVLNVKRAFRNAFLKPFPQDIFT